MSILLAIGCKPPPPAQPDAVRPVKAMVVAAGDKIRERLFSGRVEATRTADLAFAVPGLLLEFPVSEGQAVAKGELIGRLREDEFKARLQSLKGQLDQARAALRSLQAGERPEERLRREAQVRAAEATLEHARIEYERFAGMVESGAVSRSDLDRARTAYRVAQEDHRVALQMQEMGTAGRNEDIEAREADVRALEGRVAEANIQLGDCTLRAPFDGVIGRRLVDVQQTVQANVPVVTFQDTNEIDIAVDVPESVMAADIRTADIVRMDAELSGAAGLQFPARIREVAQVADPVTQTFRVRVALKAPPGVNALPGMTAIVTVAFRRAGVLGDRILVPVSAVSQKSTGEQVAWVIGPDQTVASQPVKVGEATGGKLAILEGLQPGDRIAVAGASFLRDGMKVRDLGDALGGAQP